ncbi:peptidyl-tRNA hydrolase [Cronobacter phage vB_CsaM_GAP32]|uniref:peptidyl-tRNA hydrolase n=1 Tax=Cronobacter phage vB_CsaM_GAP32 TaxID=1141136 RepID=K4FB71_9CAUD|nr:peptidyl-tRNA hydrolase [Cronobacter phage vB_CsaM_GAP32]AFC21834.1 peptidyl-tRNA hydrolase [Cronobacter phage vB_CsaM_GAP32]
MEKPVLKYKCYVLLREDLQMPVGKFAAQVGHGLDQVWSTYNEYKKRSRKEDNEDLIMPVSNFEGWHTEGRRKIILRIKDGEQMNTIKSKIQEQIDSGEYHPGFFVHDIMDYGFNFFDGLTQTGLIIYPNMEEIKAVKRLRCW